MTRKSDPVAKWADTARSPRRAKNGAMAPITMQPTTIQANPCRP
jgi:hypothetical protein